MERGGGDDHDHELTRNSRACDFCACPNELVSSHRSAISPREATLEMGDVTSSASAGLCANNGGRTCSGAGGCGAAKPGGRSAPRASVRSSSTRASDVSPSDDQLRAAIFETEAAVVVSLECGGRELSSSRDGYCGGG